MRMYGCIYEWQLIAPGLPDRGERVFLMLEDEVNAIF